MIPMENRRYLYNAEVWCPLRRHNLDTITCSKCDAYKGHGTGFINCIWNDDGEMRKEKARITSSELLDNLTEFLCDTKGLTTEELREDLEAKGIDTEKVLTNVEAMLRKYGFHKAADRMKNI